MLSNRSFSIFVFIESLNASGRQYQLVAGYSNVHAVAEALIDTMQQNVCFQRLKLLFIVLDVDRLCMCQTLGQTVVFINPSSTIAS